MNYIEYKTALKIKDTLLTSSIHNHISINSINNCFNVEFNHINKAIIDKEYFNKTRLTMLNRTLSFDYLTTILNIKKVKQPSNLFLGIGQWREDGSYFFDDTHIILGSDSTKLNNYFAQIDLSDAIEDNENIYLLKNISKKSGLGTCKRLYSKNGSLSHNERQNKFLEFFSPQTILIGDDTWFVVSTISKSELSNTAMHPQLLTKFLDDFITYAFTIEEIILL